MSIKVNGTDIGSSISLNNTALSKIVFNGINVWQARQMLKKLPYDFYNGSAVVYNNEIHILGGENSLKSHYKWNGSNWVSVSTLPYNFASGSAVVYNNEIHILGSNADRSGSESYPSFPHASKHYKWNGSNWSSVSTLPYQYGGGVAMVFNNELHILGSKVWYKDGIYYKYNYAKYHYKWNGSNWRSVSTLPAEIHSNNGVIIYDNKLYILGKTLSYYLNNNSWVSTSSPAIPSELSYSGTIVMYNNEIHLLGCYKNGDSSPWYLRHYRYKNNAWSQLSNVPYTYYASYPAVIWNSGSGDELVILGSSENPYRNYDAQWDGTSWTVGTD